MADDFDLIDYLDALACDAAEVTGVSACLVLLADPVGPLSMVAASSESARAVGVVQLRDQQGPAVEAYLSRGPAWSEDLTVAAGCWPLFAPAAVAAGFAAVHALPLGRRGQTIGALGLLSTAPGPLGAVAVDWAETLADAAAIGLIHRRILHHQETLTQQLQLALDSRVLIEQAKGVLAGRLQLSTDEAFTLLRQHARARNLKLTAFSRALICGEITIPVPGDERRGPGGLSDPGR
ncbi:GAF and ANTAR domain-containing protein [Planobispora siamensis]|uniref:GAF and ANTAR domain-containing protein n=1 Tax=Planobispora siamensis TaxID=936338 RepID=UPI00194E68D8|nr:GAF and ANTAR domain-containing protein [Planobispora siamensis]